jgi:hypothetical protein
MVMDNQLLILNNNSSQSHRKSGSLVSFQMSPSSKAE